MVEDILFASVAWIASCLLTFLMGCWIGMAEQRRLDERRYFHVRRDRR